MKKFAIGVCVTCVAVLAGMTLFSSTAQARTSSSQPAESPVRGHVEIIDVQQSAGPACIGAASLYTNLIDALAADREELTERVGNEAAAALLQQGLLVIELPQSPQPRQLAPAAPKLVGAVAE